MKFDHVFWTYRNVSKGCWLNKLDFEDDYLIDVGIPVSEDYPETVSIAMDPDFPKDTIVTDHIRGPYRICSERLVEFLKSKELPNVEYLPITILNHRGRAVDSPYFIVHPIHAVDCLDEEACEVTDSSIAKYIKSLKHFILDDAKSQNLPPLMRVKRFASHVMIHRSLAEELDEAGFTGLGWLELSDMEGESLDMGGLPPIQS